MSKDASLVPDDPLYQAANSFWLGRAGLRNSRIGLKLLRLVDLEEQQLDARLAALSNWRIDGKIRTFYAKYAASEKSSRENETVPNIATKDVGFPADTRVHTLNERLGYDAGGTMQELTNLLAEATAAIEPGFFLLSIHGGLPVYRERVYCYELYHQLRKRWPEGCAFCLNGEVDKAAHPKLMEMGANGFKPDLLVHRPGDMGGNHAVLEVKPVRSARHGAPKDLNTLSVFRRVGYERAIYLIYGEDISQRLVERIELFSQQSDMPLPVELWVHAAAGQPAMHVRTLQGAGR